MRKHDPRKHIHCPSCLTATMKQRSDGAGGFYLLCETFPKCHGTRQAPAGVQERVRARHLEHVAAAAAYEGRRVSA